MPERSWEFETAIPLPRRVRKIDTHQYSECFVIYVSPLFSKEREESIWHSLLTTSETSPRSADVSADGVSVGSLYLRDAVLSPVILREQLNPKRGSRTPGARLSWKV